ncbi:hypothetical protein EN879_35425 [Mesorhizobium sp. M7A.F.Ca.AU.002.02.1.1]|nr:hypothetical protein EN879_35425 [Mesorhizobium sp. M7A.F.Ca.AU.002.02.1.1]
MFEIVTPTHSAADKMCTDKAKGFGRETARYRTNQRRMRQFRFTVSQQAGEDLAADISHCRAIAGKAIAVNDIAVGAQSAEKWHAAHRPVDRAVP